MNRPIKQIAQIRDPNSLLNKFIIFKYSNSYLYIYYIYGIKNSNNVLAYCLLYNNQKEITYSDLSILSLGIINSNIHNAIINDCYIYIT